MRREMWISTANWFFTGTISILLILGGCNNPPKYKYQNEGEGSAAPEVKEKVSSGANQEGGAAAPTVNPGEPVTPMPVAVETALPEVSITDLLQNSQSYNNRKIRVTGRLGEGLKLYKISFIRTAADDLSVEFSYEQMPEPDQSTLSTLGANRKVTIVGVWDSSKKLLVGEGLIP